eukprot:jgi/Tetstr1/459587/TSEL_004951.t1
MRNLAKGLPAEWIHPACEQQLRHPLGKKRMAAGFLTLKKTSLVPKQQAMFLGMLVDFFSAASRSAYLVKLACRNYLYRAMTGRKGWNDAPSSDAAEFRDLLSHVDEALVMQNGEMFLKRPGGVVFVGDDGGVSGFMQLWRGLVIPLGMMAFVNKPFGALEQVLQKVAHEWVDCVLTALAWPMTWVSLLAELPVVKAVTLSRKAGSGREACKGGPSRHA